MLARKLKVRPSELADLEGYYAFCFDEAVIKFGDYVLEELEKAGKNSKTDKAREKAQEGRLKYILGILEDAEGRPKEASASPSSGGRQYKDPAGLGKRR